MHFLEPLFVILWIRCASSEDNVLISGHGYCITNGSSAIIFNEEIQYYHYPLHDINRSSFYPETPDLANFSCDFDGQCPYITSWDGSTGWNVISSLEGPIKQYVTDRRWEALWLTKTVEDGTKELNFYAVESSLENSFIDIPFSVRGKHEGHMFLCDDKYKHLSSSNCYWIMLAAWNGTKSAIRKCTTGSIPYLAGIYPGSPCKELRDVNNRTDIFNENFWTHFRVIKNGSILRVLSNNETFLEFIDNTDVFKPKKLWLHSKRVDVLWKIQNYKYLYTNRTGNDPVGPMFRAQNPLCISMFVALCDTCSLVFILRDQSGKKLMNETINSTGGTWKEIKVIHNFSQKKENEQFAISLSRKIASENDQGFWALDDVRLCSENEYRFVESKKSDTPCQEIDIRRITNLTTRSSDEIETQSIDCPENSFGKQCVPCQIFGKTLCPELKYCELTNNRRKECHCSSGYVRNCSNKCPTGTYGHGCGKKCSFCMNNDCHHSDGSCNGKCKYESFTGKQCQISPEPFLTSKPTVLNINYSSTEVRIDNFDMVDTDNHCPQYYIFQYMKDPDQNEVLQSIHKSHDKSQSPWKNIGEKIFINNTKYIRIDNLEADTFYKVRAVIIDDHHETGSTFGQDKDYIQPERWKTSCIDIRDSDIDITSTSNSATVTVKKENVHCKLQKYIYSVGKVHGTVSKTFEITRLEPFKDYNLTFSNIENGGNNNWFIKYYKTKEGIPSEVRNISYRNSSNGLNVSWTEPEHKNGDCRYKIELKFLHKIACTEDESSRNSSLKIATETTSGSFEKLKSFSEYKLTIRAYTNAGEGNASIVPAYTSSTEHLSERENIYIKALKTTRYDILTVELNKISCGDQDGEIHLKFQASCSEDWCNKTVERHYEYRSMNPTAHINGLQPFSNYTVRMDISRDKKKWSYSDSKESQTSFSVPNPISELQAYSKEENSVSLRWMPPYPPTGILKNYEILYHTNKYYGRSDYHEIKPPTNCTLWPEFHCADISINIWKSHEYYFSVRAQNEQPNWYGKQSSEIYVYIHQEAPWPPYRMSYSWDNNNDLNISWYHPNVTNGMLKSFEVTLKSKGNQKEIKQSYKLQSLNDYKLIYFLMITEDLLTPCMIYQVSIESHNRFSSSKQISDEIHAPPEYPPLITKENILYSSTNTSITIILNHQESRRKYSNEKIYVLVSESDGTEELLAFANSLRNKKKIDLKMSEIVLAADRTNYTKTFVIGDQFGNISNNINRPLEPGTNYSVTLFFVNECNGFVRLRKEQKYMITMGDPKLHDPNNENEKLGHDGDKQNGGLWALILLLFIPLIGYVYWYKKHGTTRIRGPLRPKEDTDIDEVPLTEKTTETPARVNVVKPKKSLPSQVLLPLKTKYSKRIRLVDFVEYVKTAVESGELENQHDLFPRGLLHKYERGSLLENKSKNRYKNLIAYDHTRVKLKDIPGEEYSDYINANYIDGYKKPRVYIATQGPKSSTLADFWRMIWQENVKIVVMLASLIENGKKKVEKYWPDINETTNYGGIKVRFLSEKVFANYDLRMFEVVYRREKRQLEQMHFTTWPDHGVPLYPQSLVPFLQRLLKIPYNPLSPILVHCSAGVGRTGTIILCDICLRMAAGENAVDFLANVENLRDQRANLVDNPEQYKLAHMVVLECLFGMRTAIPCSKDMEQLVERVMQNNGIFQQMKYLEETQWQDSIMETMLERDEVFPVCVEKNRFPDIIPERYRVFLSYYPTDDPTSSYINAVLVDDFRNPGRYIVTQQPMPNTLGDFWRLLIERGCSVIISLNKLNLKDKTVCKFWPTKDKEMSPVDFLVIRHVNTKKLESYEITTVLVELDNGREKLSVDIISMNNWRPGKLLPPNTEEFLAFRDAADALSRNSKNVIVTCYDGATASGLYLAMSFLIERMKLEQECDVCMAVRSIRHSRQHFVTTKEQYEYLFRASLAFINGFQCYSNFD